MIEESLVSLQMLYAHSACGSAGECLFIHRALKEMLLEMRMQRRREASLQQCTLQAMPCSFQVTGSGARAEATQMHRCVTYA